jgi:hypothetical protein
MRDPAEAVQGVGARQSLLEHPAWTRWGAHFAFWLAYLAIRTAAAGADPPDDVNDFPYFINRALVVATYCLLTGILLALVAGPRAAQSNWARNLALVLGALAIAPLTQYSEQFWPQRLAGFSPDPYPFVIYLFQFGWALPLWGLTQALLGYHFETMAQARACLACAGARLRRAAADAALSDQSAFSLQHAERDFDARAGEAQRGGREHDPEARGLLALLARSPANCVGEFDR